MLTADERLALVRIKVERAKKHISDLEVELRTFLDSNPYVVGAKPDPQFIMKAIQYYIVSVRETPNSILLIVGDVLFNLRAALDHLAYQLAWVNGTRDPKILKATYFPISDSPARYKTESPGKVKGMSKAAIHAIAATKPYLGGDNEIWRLHRLNNIDKHRFLITAGSHVVAYIPPAHLRVGIIKELAAQQAWPVGISDTEIEAIRIAMPLPTGSFPLKVGDELPLPFVSIPDRPEFKDDIKFTFEIAFNEPQVAECQPLLVTLRTMADRVDDLILNFKPLLA